MKKLVFGLIATVILSGFSYGNSTRPVKENSNYINVHNSFKEIRNSKFAPGCQDFQIGISFIGEISTSVRVCCRRLGNMISGFLGIECWIQSNKPTRELTGYINVEELDPKILEEIKNKDLKEIKITKSSIGEIGDYKYAIQANTYKIESSDEGLFIEVILEKV
jgi:hypothetical protein